MSQSCASRRSASSRPTSPEPLLAQLRQLPPARLDRLAEIWFSRLRLHDPLLIERQPSHSTYEAQLRFGVVRLPVRIRIYQRRNRLQSHHVEAFLGHLVRSGSAAGILVTTGEVASQAQRTAAGITAPQLEIVSGREWARDLISGRLGVCRRHIWQWLLCLATGPASRWSAKLRRRP